MGTNFYTAKKQHIGKRSAAGLYCFDCGVTLCKDGNDAIHFGTSAWHDRCPKCGKVEQTRANLSDQGNAAGVELGFAAPNVSRPTGVRTCCSFTWATDPKDIKRVRVVYDEYGTKFSGKEFLAMLEAQCPIQYTDSIGTEFS